MQLITHTRDPCRFSAGLGRRVTLLIGDMALQHDLGALRALSAAPHPVTVVVVNNGGGGKNAPPPLLPDLLVHFFSLGSSLFCLHEKDAF